MQIVFPLFYLYIYQLGFSIQKYDPRFWPFLRTQFDICLLNSYWSNWCLSVNLSKTNVVIFNKAGKCLKHPIYFNGTLIRSASLYRYLGTTFVFERFTLTICV
jgi:hypothetical protein